MNPTPATSPRRTYSPEFKAQLMTLCQQPGASVVNIALAHEVGVLLLRRWIRQAALERNFGAGYNVTKESGGITPVQPTRAESRHIAESRALWKDLGGGTPMLVFQTANGELIRFMGFPKNHLSTLETIVQSLKQPKSKQPKLTPYKP